MTLFLVVLLCLNVKSEIDKYSFKEKFQSFSEEYIKHLDESNFNNLLARDNGKEFTIVEFYAPWCPHCQAFDPFVQDAAKSFSTSSQSNAEIFGVDCVAQPQICNDLKVKSFPTVIVGTREKIKTMFEEKKNENGVKIGNSMLKNLAADHDLEQLVTAFNDATSSHVVPIVHTNQIIAPVKERVEAFKEIQREDIIKVVGLMFQNAAPRLQDSTNGEVFKKFVEDLSKSFPFAKQEVECFQSLQGDAMFSNADSTTDFTLNKEWKFCGKDFDYFENQLEWKACKGTSKYNRGYSCGLWSLFHSMLLHGGQFENIRNYTQYFFTCKECTTNFLTATQDYESQKQLSVDKVVIYFWKIHNGVNARLKEEEKNRPKTRDPNFPKEMWPMKNLCSSCYDVENKFVESAVLEFLNSWYNGDPQN